MTLTTKQVLIYSGIIGLLLYGLGVYSGCAWSSAKPAEKVQKSIDKSPVHDTAIVTNTIYRKGKSYPVYSVDTVPVHDSVSTPGQLQIDTVQITQEHTVVRTDTVFLVKAFDVMTALQARGHLLEARAGIEHDFLFGGYGGQIGLQLNLDKLHLANMQPFIEVGYLHGFHATGGVSGTFWGVW